MKKQPLFVAISNQKGGVGKTILTAVIASQFHYGMGKNVLVVDCDPSQHSVHGIREREKKAIEKHPGYQQMMTTQFERTGKKAYPIVNALTGNAREVAIEYLEKSDMEFDIVFFDLPGTVNSKGVLRTILNMDYVIVPLIPSNVIMQSALAYITGIQDYLNSHEGVPLKGMYVFWNSVDRRVSGEAMATYDKIIAYLKLNTLSTILPDSSRFDKEMSLSGYKPFFLSTLLLPSSKLLKGSNLDVLATEISTIIDL